MFEFKLRSFLSEISTFRLFCVKYQLFTGNVLANYFEIYSKNLNKTSQKHVHGVYPPLT